ncbi:aminotransferase class V-fold PLP-dependent enzyme [Celeribacter sp.]|uniref:aminotransferase class V-fold PLP-dependent enzyme n=1 Tax=Celeribacter sp. TaxID=1890673 RepID=UPI003A8DC894
MNQHLPDLSAFDHFRALLGQDDPIDHLRAGLIGENADVPGPNGPNKMIYADYVASGRALRQVEDFIANEVLPYYANSHTEASFCGQTITRLRNAARREVLRICGGDARHAAIFTGSGATAGLNRLTRLLGVSDAAQAGKNPLVLIGPYEHHSNILPWRESGAEVVEVPEAATGGPDLSELERMLEAAKGRLVVGAFSAASNVTGIVSDVVAVTKLLNAYGARSVWDYAGGGPYLPINMTPAPDAEIDAIVVSPHKFIGGPGASGLLLVRREAVAMTRPTAPGGGTVSFVSPWGHDYSGNVEAREEAGTPNVVGDIRAALCLLVKEAIGQERMHNRLQSMRRLALGTWEETPGLRILGNPKATHVLPIFSFLVTDPQGRPVHQQLFTRMLSDYYGIQARGGCACAGPYGHRLLEISQSESERMRTAIRNGHEIEKPGWTRLGFSVLMDDAKVEKIIHAVDALARNPQPTACHYNVDPATARFSHKVV